MDDEITDWKSITTLPKRGEKDFMPDGTVVQTSLLEDSQTEMYSAISTVRGHHVKNKLIGVWCHDKCLVIHAKGSFFKDMGVAAAVLKSGQSIWLDPIETLYLVERGSMAVYFGDNKFISYVQDGGLRDGVYYDFPVESVLQKLSLSHLYSLAISDSDLMEKYQVYAYLKRLGYIVLPHKQIIKTYPEPAPVSVFSRVFSLSYKFPSHHRHFLNYTEIFKSLPLTPSHHAFERVEASSQYKLAFNVWKPTQHFPKKNPPPPDFQICIINILHQTFPSLADIHSLFNSINYTQRENFETIDTKSLKKSLKSLPPTKKELRLQRQTERQSKLDPAVQTRNKYLKARDKHLREGFRTVVLAVVDNGIMSFNKLCEADFSLSNGTSDLDELMPKRKGIHGIVPL